MRRIIRASWALAFLSAVILVLSVIGSGDLRDDRLGMVEIAGGRLKAFSRNGLIAGTVIDSYQIVVTWHVGWTIEGAQSLPLGWAGLFSDFHIDGEDAECGAHVLPLGIPMVACLALAFLFQIQSQVRRNRRQARGFCIRCAYDLCGTHFHCPECGNAVSGFQPSQIRGSR